MCANAMWLLLCLCACAHAQTNPGVLTTQGLIVGRRSENDDYFTFFGIPYGGDTSGENRFKAPTPVPPFPGEFNAIDNTIRCLQPGPSGIIGTENCLVLNIHTNNLTTPKPVLVFIEGTDYESTSATTIPVNSLVREDLLVVTINYRLSIFGFLCLGVADAPGNAGLKDIILGLKWIKDNIAGFGGDPNNVVLLGHGSGAAMVDLITISPLSRNLTHKAIALSGTGLAPWAVSYDPVRNAELVGEKLLYSYGSREDFAKQLASTNANELMRAITAFEFFNATLAFAPCIENPKLNPVDAFLTEAPINILRNGSYTQIPYLVGFVDREGTVRIAQATQHTWLARMQSRFPEFIQTDLAFESEENKTTVAQSIRNFYFGERIIDRAMLENYFAYHGDVLAVVPIVRGARERALTSKANVWMFQFAFRGTYNSDWRFPDIPLNGVRHGGILNYLFEYDLRIMDYEISAIIIDGFKNFAYKGIPGSSNIENFAWDPVSQRQTPVLLITGGIESDVFTSSITTNNHFNRENREFWDPIFTRHYRTPMPVSSANTLLSFGLTIVITQALLTLY